MSINGWIDREDMICLYTGILCVCMLSHFSHVQLFAMPWTVARQTPLSMGFSRQVYWSGLPCCPPGDLPDPGTEPASLLSPALSDSFFTTSTSWDALSPAFTVLYFFHLWNSWIGLRSIHFKTLELLLICLSGFREDCGPQQNILFLSASFHITCLSSALLENEYIQ